jgi:hypothetical protein
LASFRQIVDRLLDPEKRRHTIKPATSGGDGRPPRKSSWSEDMSEETSLKRFAAKLSNSIFESQLFSLAFSSTYRQSLGLRLLSCNQKDLLTVFPSTVFFVATKRLQLRWYRTSGSGSV